MKNKKLIAAGICALALGAVAGVVGTQVAAVETKATDTVTVYFRDASWWNKDAAGTAIIIDGAAPVLMTHKLYVEASKFNYWTYEVPANAETIAFRRVNGEDVSDDWGAQTVDVTFAGRGDGNLYDISATSAVWTSASNYARGLWAVATPEYTAEVLSGYTVTAATMDTSTLAGYAYLLAGNATQGWGDTYIYTWGGNSFYGSWPGTKMTGVTFGLDFNADAGPADNERGFLVQIPVYKYLNDNRLQISCGTDDWKCEQASLSLQAGKVYNIGISAGDTAVKYQFFETGSSDEEKVAIYQAAHAAYTLNKGMGTATITIDEVETKIAGSICGLGSGAISDGIVAAYNLMATDAAKGFFNNTTIYTYASTVEVAAAANVGCDDIYAGILALRSGGSPLMSVTTTNENAVPVTVAIAAAIIIGGAALAGGFIIAAKRRRHF